MPNQTSIQKKWRRGEVSSLKTASQPTPSTTKARPNTKVVQTNVPLLMCLEESASEWQGLAELGKDMTGGR
jgi:hypothetical protein